MDNSISYPLNNLTINTFSPVDNGNLKMHGTPYKKYYRENLKSWITYQNQEPYYQYLELIEKLVQSVFRQEKTVNPLEELSQQIEEKIDQKNQQLFRELVHALTLLNHTYRVFAEEGYVTAKEDILNAAALLQLDINPESMLFFRTQMIYWEIQNNYPTDEFTVKEVSNRLGINKKTMSRHIIALRNTGKIKHHRTGIRNTYYYKLANL